MTPSCRVARVFVLLAIACASTLIVTAPVLAAELASTAAQRAEAVSGPVLQVSASSHSFGTVRIGTSDNFGFTLSNTGTEPAHVTGVDLSDASAGFTCSLDKMTIDPGSSALLTAAFAPEGSGSFSLEAAVHSDALNGDIVVRLTGFGNGAPYFDPPLSGTYQTAASAPWSLVALATDPENDPLRWTIEGLPVGATLAPGTGTISWIPEFAGTYPMTISVEDPWGKTSWSFVVVVGQGNSRPVIRTGGPYEGVVGVPVIFDASGSSDPDAGQVLSFFWDFGDGSPTVAGVTAPHAYSVAGQYQVTLSATDNGVPPAQISASTFATVTGAPLSAYGTAHVDGQKSPGEWDKAARLNFRIDRPESEGRGTVPGTLYVMNDGSNLYFALEVGLPSFGGATSFAIEFDNDADGIRENLDDAVVVNADPYSVLFADDARVICPGETSECPGCSFQDERGMPDAGIPPGTTDGEAAAADAGSSLLFYELAHPFRSGDSYDLNLQPGDITSFTTMFRYVDFTCSDWPSCFGDTFFPTIQFCSTGEFQKLVIASGPRVHATDVDLDPDVLNLKNRARWITATIEPHDFDLTEINAGSLQLAGVPVEAKSSVIGDRDQDGVPDMTVRFGRAGLEPLLTPGSNQLQLSGILTNGEKVEGSGQIRVINPPNTISASVLPNPLRSSGDLHFVVARAGAVSVTLFDAQGRLVRTLLTRKVLPIGVQHLAVDGKNDAGEPLASGIYFYRVETVEGVATGRLAMLR